MNHNAFAMRTRENTVLTRGKHGVGTTYEAALAPEVSARAPIHFRAYDRLQRSQRKIGHGPKQTENSGDQDALLLH